MLDVIAGLTAKRLGKLAANDVEAVGASDSVTKQATNDIVDNYEKTMDRIIERFNGHDRKYRDEMGRFISRKQAAANDKIDYYEKTMDRIMARHNGHDEALPTPANTPDAYESTMDRIMMRHNGHDRQLPEPDNDRRIIHDYEPNIPPALGLANIEPLKPVKKGMRTLTLKDREDGHSVEPVSTYKDGIIPLLKSIDNNTLNTVDILTRISHTIDDMTGGEGIAGLRAKEKDIESRQGNQPQDQKNSSSMDQKGKSGNEKLGLRDVLLGGGELATIGTMGAVGAGITAIGALGPQQKEVKGGGFTGKDQAPGARAESRNRVGGVEPQRAPQIVPSTEQTHYSNRTLSLSAKDIKDLKKTVKTEWVQSAGVDQAHGIIDTILNRTASGHWGHTVRDVVNAKSQFSAINGGVRYDPHKKAAHGVQDIPDSIIDAKVNKVVDDYLRARAHGKKSSVADNLNYANPFASDRSNLKWINKLDGPVFGSGKAIHRHGTTEGLRRYKPGDFRLDLGEPFHMQSWKMDSDAESAKIVKQLKGKLKSGQQMKLSDGSSAGKGSVTINITPSNSAPQRSAPNTSPAPDKKRVPPARHDYREIYKKYFAGGGW